MSTKQLPKYYRCGHIIRTVERDDTGRITGYSDEHFMCGSGSKAHMQGRVPSINQAKKKSRELQKAEGGLGCGILQVVDKLFTAKEHKKSQPKKRASKKAA